MKVTAKEYTTIEKELDLEYPIYLYFQTELGEDEVIKVMPQYKISVFFNMLGAEIKKSYNSGYSEHLIINNLTTEKHFNESFDEVVEHLTDLKNGN